MMRVGDNQIAGRGDDLVEQMRSAHAEAADAAGAADGVGGATSQKGVGQTDGPADAADGPDGLSASNPLEESLLETARGALRDEFDGADEVREAVVDSIIEERWSHVADDELSGAARNMLSGDLAFRAEVDNMLLHAARRLGAADG